jgi:hypothetical protein
MNSIILTFCRFVTLFMFDFFLLVYFKFGYENSRYCKDISCVHPEFCFKFFTSYILNFKSGIMVAF